MSSKSKVAKQIFFTYLLLFITTICYYMLKGFDDEEFASLIAVISPILGVYGGVLSKSIEVKDNGDSKNLYPSFTFWLIPIHFICVFCLISSKALFNIISFKEMILILGFVEAVYGGLISSALSIIFDHSKNEKNV